MDSGQLATYRQLLEVKRSEVIASKPDSEQIMIERSADSLDELVLKGERDLAIDQLNRAAELLTEVSAALERVDAGLYGACLRCDHPIPERRLKALPWAALCFECQESADKEAVPDHVRSLSDAA